MKMRALLFSNMRSRIDNEYWAKGNKTKLNLSQKKIRPKTSVNLFISKSQLTLAHLWNKG